MLDQVTVFFRSRKTCCAQVACQKSIFYHDFFKYSASNRRVKVSDRWPNNVMFTKLALLDTAQNINITFPDSGGPVKTVTHHKLLSGVLDCRIRWEHNVDYRFSLNISHTVLHENSHATNGVRLTIDM